MYYHTFYKSTFSSPLSFLFYATNAFIADTSLFWDVVVLFVVVWYFFKQINRLTFCSCYNNCLVQAVDKSTRIVTHLDYKDDALVLALRSRKHGSLGMCTIPIVNTNNKTRNQTLWELLAVSSGLYFSLCQTRQMKVSRPAVHHLLPTSIFVVHSLVTLAANWTRGWCSLLP